METIEDQVLKDVKDLIEEHAKVAASFTDLPHEEIRRKIYRKVLVESLTTCIGEYRASWVGRLVLAYHILRAKSTFLTTR